MSRKQYNSQNKLVDIFTFPKSGSTSSFDPTVAFSFGPRRVSWRLFNGTDITQIAGNSITYTGFTSDNNIRNIEMRGTKLKNISTFQLNDDNLFGNFNFLYLSGVTNFNVSQNSNLTGITHPNSSNTFTNYNASSCNLIGNLNLTSLSGLGGTFNVSQNSNLTGITYTPTSTYFYVFNASFCNLIGDLNLTGITNPTNGFVLYLSYNLNLTSVTHNSGLTLNTNTYKINNCNLTGNLNVANLGYCFEFDVSYNPNLTGITHTNSLYTTMYDYLANDCNLTGNLNLSACSLGRTFDVSNNPNLTGITHGFSLAEKINYYKASNCNLTGLLDLSTLGEFDRHIDLSFNPQLTDVFFGGITDRLVYLDFGFCNINYVDFTYGVPKIGSEYMFGTSIIELGANPNLTFGGFPTTPLGYIDYISFCGCNVDYIDFTPLTNLVFKFDFSFGSNICLSDNNMIADDVNHILYDFTQIAFNNPTGWSNLVLNIGGTNANPDSFSGGYDGLSAISVLTTTYGWTIFY